MPPKKKPKEEPEFFSPTDHAASLNPFQMERRIDAESSMFRWAQVVMGYEKLEDDEYCEFRLYEPIHRPMCDRVESKLPIKGRERRKTQAKLLDLEPRKCLKTYLITATGALFYLTQNYDGRILIGSHKRDAAKDILKIVKWHMEFNPTFKELYGDWAYYAKKFGIWRDDYIELAFRTMGLRDPTITTTGAEVSTTGGHYDVAFIDDIQSRENVKSQLERMNVRERFQEYFPQVVSNGALIVPATRYHRADLYGWIMKRVEAARKRIQSKNLNPKQQAEEESWLFDIFVHSAYNDDGTLYYPYGLSAERLAQEKDELEDYLFSVWYLNEPLDETAKVFVNPYDNQRDFDFVRGAVPYIEFPNGTRRSIYVSASWDPKGRDNPNKPNDAHGFIINGTDSIGGWWTLEALELRKPLDELLDIIALRLRHYNAQVLSIETRGSSTQGLYIDLLRPVLQRYGITIRIHEWSPGTTESKDTLIRSLQPQHRRGLWHFRRGYCEPLLQQLDDYPMVEHDDLLDAAVQQKSVARPVSEDDIEVAAQNEEDFDKGEEPVEQEYTDGAWVGLGTPTGAIA